MKRKNRKKAVKLTLLRRRKRRRKIKRKRNLRKTPLNKMSRVILINKKHCLTIIPKHRLMSSSDVLEDGRPQSRLNSLIISFKVTVPMRFISIKSLE